MQQAPQVSCHNTPAISARAANRRQPGPPEREGKEEGGGAREQAGQTAKTTRAKMATDQGPQQKTRTSAR